MLQDGADHSDDAVVAADILRDRRTRDRQRTSAASAAAWLLLEGAQAAMKCVMATPSAARHTSTHESIHRMHALQINA